MLDNGIKWRVGDGTCINIREDLWFPKPSTFKARTRVGLQATLVCDFIDPAAVAWKTDVIVGGFYKEDVASILSIPLSRNGQGDRLVWHHSKNGAYTVRTGYGVVLGLMENGKLGRKKHGASSSNSNLNQVWNKIWSLEFPNKISSLSGNITITHWQSEEI